MYSSYHNYNKFGLNDLISSPASLAKKVSCGLIIGLSLYIIAPNLHALVFGNSQQRIGKYTTVGLINNGNDCFITSSLQSLAGIPRFVKYLKAINLILRELNKPDLKSDLSRDAEGESLAMGEIIDVNRCGGQLSSSTLLHESLLSLVSDLVSMREHKKTISPKIVVKTFESIFKSKISSQQNDAHEFTLLLLQTLQEEHSKLVEYTKYMSDSNVPKFPFQGQTSKFLTCLQCNRTSKPSYQESFIRELMVPQQSSEKLAKILANDETEIIEDYSCLICQIRAILNHEKYRNFKNCSQEELTILDALRNYANDASINEDLPIEVEQYIKHYAKDKLRTSNVKSKVIKKDVVVQLPEILVIHLSRSTFNGMTYTRNPCNVKFEETIKLAEYASIENGTLAKYGQIEYDLKSVVKHTGSHSRGHYVCYRSKGDILFDSEVDSYVESASIIIDNDVEAKNHIQTITSMKNCNGKRRYKKVKSALKYPYWQISDANIKESKTSTVLNEQKYAYMLYYERVNK
ncbi:hypothetical protein SEUBUCD646_0P02120 [Saccharomyces eubayanus]|uniref:Ubiquitin carboxyl-terminal hydrolase n=2 Tax=Saccharomyces TaxID=4930 RepID=A0A6C1EHU7_SACPS|nr:ubiquitin-specific protease [Saccharomyces pastorianus]CAI1762338.1 hypothetical protein SEUBUCD650_0P02130 [Saccharomyces eubayanus]CAI1797728.1 hypothetical protein SEUBUCD646_0P02120 [Saccharomyces eubayanus]